ncbi:MAG: anhydro-N-acetylmuramic acid kinase [Ignavibacteria bacterium]|nr:anhydro-N-acetylmuramic acid kinase [Ignavibacteria bacterium]
MSKIGYISADNKRKAIGILSGTSVDAVDVVLTDIMGTGTDIKIKVIDYFEYKIPPEIKNFVLETSVAGKGTVENVCKLNFILGRFYASCINRFLKSRNLKNKDIDFIGSHGQTIHHLPKKEKLFGILANSTLQIGDPSVIANLTGITTVGDFRTADMAVGGGGAPLVPYLDFVLFRKKSTDRILLNIGGISNITYLKRNGTFDEVIAFDTGPGNMMIDYLAKKYFNKDFDKNCVFADKGKVNQSLFCNIRNKDIFLKAKPPKSTGRELYSGSFVESILKKHRKINPYDIIATFTEYTAFSIVENIRRFTKIKNQFELIVSGGGSKNKHIISYLKTELKNSKIVLLDDNGINTSNKEAVLFAVLANEALYGGSANIKSVTGAVKNVILGKICRV